MISVVTTADNVANVAVAEEAHAAGKITAHPAQSVEHQHHDLVVIQIEARTARHVAEHPVHLDRVLILVGGGQLRQPCRAIVRIDPAQHGGGVARIASGLRRAELQMQPPDRGVFRRQVAGARDQLQCRGGRRGTANW